MGRRAGQIGSRGRGDLWAYSGVLAATLIWGTLHPIGKVALQEISALQLVLARATLTGVSLALVLLVSGRLTLLASTARTRFPQVVGLGLLSFFASSGLAVHGLAYLPASTNSLLANTSPLMLAFGIVVATRRLPRGRVLLGLVLGFVGVALLTASGAADLGAIGVLGVVLSLGGSLTWAIYTGWSRLELQRGDPIAITVGASLVGAVPLLAIAVATNQLTSLIAARAEVLLMLLYMGVVGTALTYTLWMSALRSLSATSVSAFQYVIPLNAVALAVVLLGEPLTIVLVAGGAAILAGVALAQERG